MEAFIFGDRKFHFPKYNTFLFFELCDNIRKLTFWIKY